MKTTPDDQLTETRKADREVMAGRIASLATEMGATVNVEPPCWEPRDIHVNITTPQGLCLSVEFSHKSCQPNVYVLSWHFKDRSETKLSFAFAHGCVNTFHRRKATEVAYGFPQLCDTLLHSLEMVRDGSAFEPEPTIA